MAKKSKIKISRVKRNNHTTNKMKKQGSLKLQRHRQKLQKQRPQATVQQEYSDSEASASGDEWGDMLDDAEQEYIALRLAKQPQLLANVPEKDEEIKKQRRPRKGPKMPSSANSDSGAESEGLSDSDVEERYEKEVAKNPKKKMRSLLPIKTKEGVLTRSEECEESDSDKEDEPPTKKQKQSENTDVEGSDSGLEGAGEEELIGIDDANIIETDDNAIVDTVELVIARRERLKKEKLRIGALCSSLLESPEKKIKNFFPILFLMEEKLKDGTENLLSVRKLAALSAYEVFKDILPDYSIRHQDYSDIKLKKDTLALYKYEKELLEFYKRYLQRLEKAMTVLRPKKGDRRKPNVSCLALAVISLRCMCGLLIARPNFNYATNIAQSVIPLLDHKDGQVRAVVSECCTTVFKEDNKGEVTLALVRLINQLVKRRADRLKPQALDCLLDLNIRNISLDEEADLKYKQKKEERHKKRIINLSKKEKKRSKKLRDVERELLETEAQESVAKRNKHLTEVTKTLFHIYFRILKTAPHSRLLAASLNGLAKFTHVINLEFYSDLVSILSRLVDDALIGPRERLLCVRTVLAVLAGRGDTLNVDPARFHAQLYASMLDVHAGKTEEYTRIIIESILQVAIRSRRVSPAVLQAYGKRLVTLSMQLQHNGALSSLITLHQIAQQSKAVQSLLETGVDEVTGSGRYLPLSPSPEHCAAHAAAAYELAPLRRHYHPTVRAAAAALASPGHSLPSDLIKLSPLKVLEEYNGSQMSFKPAIPPPKSTNAKKLKQTASHTWLQTDLRDFCSNIELNVSMDINFVNTSCK